MKAKELAAKLLETPELEVYLVADDLGVGGDTFAPLDMDGKVAGGVALGSTYRLCCDEPTPVEGFEVVQTLVQRQ